MDPKITYVFGSGRTIKLESNNQSAKDFFYGYLDFKDEFIDTDFLEFDKDVSNAFFYKLLYFLSKILKLSNLPFFFESILSKKKQKNLKIQIILLPLLTELVFHFFHILFKIKFFLTTKQQLLSWGC